MDVISPAADHSNRTAFLFVPNLCNAACAFCYVRPSFARHAKASQRVVARGEVVASALHKLGFAEVRLTGGEPSLFANLDEVLDPFLRRGFKYRLLTNGLALMSQAELLERHPPKRVTLSVHSTRTPSEFFGVAVDVDHLRDTRRWIASISELEATLVVNDPNTAEPDLAMSLAELRADGVKHIKIIQENSTQKDHSREFLQLTARLNLTWRGRFDSIRVTRTSQRRCLLDRKAFPSFELGTGQMFACCVQVGDRTVPDGYSLAIPSDTDAVAADIERLVEHARTIDAGHFPCAEASVYCPLALQ